MTKKQKEAYLLAMKVDEDHERTTARDKRRDEFWAGLKKIDLAVRSGYATPKGRIRQLLDDVATKFDHGEVDTSLLCWNVLEYIGSFNMEYSYVGVISSGVDGDTGLELLDVIMDSDTIDEVSLTEQLRKALTNYLSAAAALAKAVGSTTYQDWVQLIMDLNFEFRQINCVFSERYQFGKFKAKIEGMLPRLWAENHIAHRGTHP